MLTSIIGLAITLFSHLAPVNSVSLRGDVRLQDGAVRLSAQNIAQLQAQAEGGNAAAQLQLARAYDSGASVPQDEQLAAKSVRVWNRIRKLQ
jgi:TPR repeat protein